MCMVGMKRTHISGRTGQYLLEGREFRGVGGRHAVWSLKNRLKLLDFILQAIATCGGLVGSLIATGRGRKVGHCVYCAALV